MSRYEQLNFNIDDYFKSIKLTAKSPQIATPHFTSSHKAMNGYTSYAHLEKVSSVEKSTFQSSTRLSRYESFVLFGMQEQLRMLSELNPEKSEFDSQHNRFKKKNETKISFKKNQANSAFNRFPVIPSHKFQSLRESRENSQQKQKSKSFFQSTPNKIYNKLSLNSSLRQTPQKQRTQFKIRKTDSIQFQLSSLLGLNFKKDCQVQKQRVIHKDDFEIGRVMGKGQFGSVMMVRHKKTGFLCGMKIMPKQIIREEKYINQIVRELSIQFYLAHRNIAPLYGYFSDPDNVYLLLQFCEGGQMLDRLKKVIRLEESEVSMIIRQILEGLNLIHQQQIIHRDLKPENILFNLGVVKISDFGWAVFHSNRMRKTASGSPLYYPPEIVKGEEYDDKIDIWSIGMMTYECLLGRVPFSIYTEFDLHRIVSDEVTFPPYVEVSEEAKDFILQAMCKDPLQRIEVQEMLRHPFITKYQNKTMLKEIEQQICQLLL